MSLINKKKKVAADKKKFSVLEKRANKMLKDRAESRSFDDDELDDEEDEIISNFEDKLDALNAEGSKSTEVRDIKVLKLMQQLVLDLIPIAEKNYKKFPLHTNASAVNSLISQERELQADIRALESFQERANRIVTIVTEEYQHITETLIASTLQLEGRIKKSGKVKEEIAEFLREQGAHLETSRSQVGQRVLAMMTTADERKKGR